MLQSNPEAKALYITNGPKGFLPSLERMDRDDERRNLVSHVHELEAFYDPHYSDKQKKAYLEGLRKVKEYYDL